MLASIILRSGAIVLAAITVVAALNLSATLEDLVSRFPAPLGLGGIATVLAIGLLSVAVVWLLLRLAAMPRGQRWVPWLGIGLALGARLAVALLIDAPLRADAAIQNELAIEVAEGACCFGHRPMGYPLLLGAAYSLLGIQPWVAGMLNVLLGTLTAVLVWDLARQSWGDRAGALALGLYAVIPSQVLLVTVPLSELTYALLLSMAVWAIVQWRQWLIPAAVGGGLLLALSQYVRPTSMVLLPLLAAVPVLAGAPLRRGALAGTLMAAAFIAALLPVVAFNLRTHESLSLSTSAYGGWTLFVGANQEWNGKWNPDDAAILAALPGNSTWERSQQIGRMALERISSDPRAYANLMVRKFNVMWSDERYAVDYAVRHLDGRTVHAAALAAHLAYVVVLALATLAAWQLRRPPSIMLAIVLIVLAVAGMHLFVEVHGRYHAYLVPLLCVLAGAAVTVPAVSRRLPTSLRERTGTAGSGLPRGGVAGIDT
jgi:hypothetical protein